MSTGGFVVVQREALASVVEVEVEKLLRRLLAVPTPEAVDAQVVAPAPVVEEPQVKLTQKEFLRLCSRIPEGRWTMVWEYGSPESAGMMGCHWRSQMDGKWLTRHLVRTQGRKLMVYRAPKLKRAKEGV